MRAGRLRHRVDIQLDVSGGGDEQVDFSGMLAEGVPCRVHDIGGAKVFRGRQLKAHITTVVELRWIEGLSNQLHRFDFGGRILNIESIVDVDGRRRQAEVHCTEVAR